MVAKLKRNRKSGKEQNMFFSVFVVLIFLLTILFLVVNNIKASQRRAKLTARIKVLENKIQQVKKQQEELKNKISQAKSKENIEKVARDQFNLKKPGEGVVVVKKNKKENGKTKKEENKNWWDMIKSILNH